MSVFFEKHKSKIYPFILIFIYALFIFLSWGKWGHFLADSFREAIIPQELLNGKVLYSDITNLYPPLAYQLNALLFLVFGNSLNTLYVASILCSFAVLSIIYKLAKEYSSDFTAFIIVLSAMEIFVFRVNILNSASWIFPYSYSFLYAFTACIFAFAAYCRYKKDNNNKYLYFTFLLTGLSVAFKYDFLLFVFLPLYEVLKNKSMKQFIYGVLLFLFPSLISFGIYLLAGGTLSALLNQVNFLRNFSQAPSVMVFNKYVLAQHINSFVLTCLFYSAVEFLICFLGLFVYFYFTGNIIGKCKNLLSKIFLISVFSLFAYMILIKAISYSQLNHFGNHANFVFIPYFICISAILIFYLKIKKKNYSYKEKFYFLLTLGGLCMIYRQIAAISISYIGNFIIILYWFAFIYFWLELMPEYYSFFQREKTKKIIAAAFIVFGFSILLVHQMFARQMTYKIQTDKGTLYTGINYGKPFTDAFQYIEENISQDKTLLVMDEGLIFNYLSNRKTNLKYYALIPHMIDTYGELRIIEDLNNNPPDFIFITNNKYPMIGKFGIDYANNIIQFVLNNYECEKIVSYPQYKPGLVIAIFKRK